MLETVQLPSDSSALCILLLYYRYTLSSHFTENNGLILAKDPLKFVTIYEVRPD
ncbi:hypothetical protein GCM10027450_07790 [Pseudidiomarina andamanensis]